MATLAKKNKSIALPYLLDRLQAEYPDAHCALKFSNPFELLIATILSAQCTDERVNQVTPKLFAHYSSPKSMAEARLEEIEKIIRPTGFFKNKAKSLVGCSKKIMELHSGEIPKDIDSLTELPGVGRKTANVVLGNAFGIASGVVVDTHVTRLSNRWGLTKSRNAEVIEKELNKIVPQIHWIQFSHWLIQHGRSLCKARSPLCNECFLFDRCPKLGV